MIELIHWLFNKFVEYCTNIFSNGDHENIVIPIIVIVVPVQVGGGEDAPDGVDQGQEEQHDQQEPAQDIL